MTVCQGGATENVGRRPPPRIHPKETLQLAILSRRLCLRPPSRHHQQHKLHGFASYAKRGNYGDKRRSHTEGRVVCSVGDGCERGTGKRITHLLVGRRSSWAIVGCERHTRVLAKRVTGCEKTRSRGRSRCQPCLHARAPAAATALADVTGRKNSGAPDVADPAGRPLGASQATPLAAAPPPLRPEKATAAKCVAARHRSRGLHLTHPWRCSCC